MQDFSKTPPWLGGKLPTAPFAANIRLRSRFKQFHRIAVWVFQQNLLTSGAFDNFVAKAHAFPLHFGNARRQIINF